MTDQPSVERARALLADLLAAAKTGAIIPARLPDQIAAILTALPEPGAAVAPSPAPAGSAPADSGGFDREAWLKDQAYFLGHAIHELRTPMTSIRGYSDMLSNAAMGPLTDMQRQFLDTVRTNSRRMETLLTDFSDMNKIRAGTLKLSTKMDMFKNVAGLVEKTAAPLAEQLGTTFSMEIPSGLPILNTDGELFAKALSKLVENALRYQRPDSDAKTVTLRASADGKTLVVQVIDRGIGMTPAEVAQLGTIYFRSDNEVVRSFKGSGLGVPVAYGILAALGGTVSVDSTPQTGTTFTVRLTSTPPVPKAD